MAVRIPFRKRAHEVTRIESFGDIVFGFALTLIVVAIEVPTTFAQLIVDIGGFLGFAACFALLVWLWYLHYTFFRRYGLTDGVTIVLNALLLFLVLFYVYPLKFLFALWTRQIQDPGIGLQDISTLFTIYGLGFAAIFFVFMLLWRHAWRLREELKLNAVELHDTRTDLKMFGAYITIALASVVIANVAHGRSLAFAGYVYFLLGPASGVIGAMAGKRRSRIEDQMLGLESHEAEDERQSLHVAPPQTTANKTESEATPIVP